MRHAQRFSIGIGCLLSLASAACSNSASPTTPAAGTPSTPTSTAGSGTTTTPTAGAGTTTPKAGTTGTVIGTAGAASAAGTPASTGTGGTLATTAGTTGSTAGMTGASAGAGFKTCGKPAATGMCKANGPGVYAMRTDIDVWWRDDNNPSSPLTDPGRGILTVYFKAELSDICEDGSGGVATIQTCGDIIPPLLTDANCGVIQIVFPDEMWDSPKMPKFTTTGGTSSFDPGGILTIAKTAGLVGVELMSSDATWPTFNDTTTFTCPSGAGEKCFPDHDNDGKPGVTVKLKTDGTPPAQKYMCGAGAWEYSTGPLGLLEALDKGAGATETYIGLRTRLGGSGKIGADCKSGVGSADADGFETRMIDCMTKTGPCSASGANFLDQNLPNFRVLKAGEAPPADWKHARAEADMTLDRSPSKGPQSSVVRLGDLGTAATCAQIRSATFPAN